MCQKRKCNIVMNQQNKKTNTIKNKIVSFITHPIMLLLLVSIMVYGVFVPLLGYFWDDMGMAWNSDVFGNEGIARYFTTKRPVWAWFYQLSNLLLGKEPWQWQVFGIFWRWICASGFYLLVRQLWPGSKEPALFASFFFLLYPGFEQQYIGLIYGHFFLIFSSYLFSVILSIYALTHKKYRKLAVIVAIVLSAINVFSMEYYFMLELLRPVFFWVLLPEKFERLIYKLKRVFLLWLPYLSTLLASAFWRTFIFEYQTVEYHLNNLDLLKTNPWQGILFIAKTVVHDVWWTALGMWQLAFQIPSKAVFGERATLLYLGVMAGIVVLFILVFIVSKHFQERADSQQHKQSLLFLLLGFIALFPAGVPFWVTGLTLTPSFSGDRYSIPFILGSSLIFTGVLFLLPKKPYLRRLLFIILIALAGGLHSRHGVNFQRDWEMHQRFMWQMVWRMPSLEAQTAIFTQELPLKYYSDHSLTGALNWTYDPNPNSFDIKYALYYPTVRSGGTLSEQIDHNQTIDHNLGMGYFRGNTSQSITLYYNPPACLRIIDYEIEAENTMLPLYIREASKVSSTVWILSEPQTQPPTFLYQPEPSPNWCYYFEKADLARQYGDWETVVEIGNTALSLEDNANDPAERLPFIEGYAHTGDWQRALMLTQDSLNVTGAMQPVLCALWQRIDTETANAPEKDAALIQLQDLLNCQR